MNRSAMQLLGRLPDEAAAIVRDDDVPKGERNDSLLKVAYGCAEAGLTNHEILIVLEDCAERWNKYTSQNLYLKWSRLLAIIRKVRTNCPVRPA